MDIRLQLIARAVGEMVEKRLDYLTVDADSIAKTTAMKIVEEIQDVLFQDELSDFDMVENIVVIFEKYHISAGATHDF